MQRINRILAFASVSFVLIFIAKINKVGLYTAYFKTIAEVEVRNSQDIAPDVLNQSLNLLLKAGQNSWDTSGHSAADLRESVPVLAHIPISISSYYSAANVFVQKDHAFHAVEPRAPNA